MDDQIEQYPGRVVSVGQAPCRLAVEIYDGLPRSWPRRQSFDGMGLTHVVGFEFPPESPVLREPIPWGFLYGEREGLAYTEHNFETKADAEYWLRGGAVRFGHRDAEQACNWVGEGVPA